jgi:hypothetical protein
MWAGFSPRDPRVSLKHLSRTAQNHHQLLFSANLGHLSTFVQLEITHGEQPRMNKTS